MSSSNLKTPGKINDEMKSLREKNEMLQSKLDDAELQLVALKVGRELHKRQHLFNQLGTSSMTGNTRKQCEVNSTRFPDVVHEKCISTQQFVIWDLFYK